MIRIIDDKDKIQTLHQRLLDSLRKYFYEEVDCYVGYPSGSFRTTVRYSPELNIWLANHIEGKKYWNGFGIGTPLKNKGNSLVGEINYPVKGNRKNLCRCIWN